MHQPIKSHQQFQQKFNAYPRPERKNQRAFNDSWASKQDYNFSPFKAQASIYINHLTNSEAMVDYSVNFGFSLQRTTILRLKHTQASAPWLPTSLGSENLTTHLFPPSTNLSMQLMQKEKKNHICRLNANHIRQEACTNTGVPRCYSGRRAHIRTWESLQRLAF